MSLVGHTIGQYQVVAELGRGQHTTVYKAWQQSLQRYVTLKVLLRSDEVTLQQFREEARLTAQLIQQGVPNVRQVYEVGQTTDGYLYIAMEYVDNSLQRVLDWGRNRKQCMDPTAAAHLLQPVAEALDAIHSLGWAHLDIKPQNILIFKGGRAVLADFGIAKRRGMQTNVCTPTYASPEQAAGDQPVGPWSDIYSLGAVLYDMVTGRPPVRGEHDIVLLSQHLYETPPSPRQFNPRLTLIQEQAILKALAKRPDDRYRTAGQLIQAMLQNHPVSDLIKMPSAFLSRTMSRTRRASRPVLIGSILTLIVVVLTIITWALWLHPSFIAPTAPSTLTKTLVPAEILTLTTASTLSPIPPTETATPTATVLPTATLAPTLTRTPRPTATPTHRPTPQPTASWSPTP
ncbi:MAG: serine/threonine-protein kinase [Anaerolineae bacterium]